MQHEADLPSLGNALELSRYGANSYTTEALSVQPLFTTQGVYQMGTAPGYLNLLDNGVSPDALNEW
jgi:hypothetical protein